MMSTIEFGKIVEKYLKKFGVLPVVKPIDIHSETKIIITIPCYNEPFLEETLDSLLACETSHYPVEVFILLNGSEADTVQVKQQNARTVEAFKTWERQTKLKWDNISFTLIEALDLTIKHAGVGLARKMVMDYALQCFANLKINGWIVCFDADSTVSSNYLVALEKAYVKNSEAVGGSFYYEHDLESVEGELREGIIYYELFLRYYIQGLKYAQYPFAYHTIGSSMFCSALAYAKVGGMNRRKAGEDFYFLHKLMPQGKFIELNQLKVIPSCRISDRVPFGTGRAQQNWMNGDVSKKLAYHPHIFEELKILIKHVPDLFKKEYKEWLNEIPLSIQVFLKENDFSNFVEEAFAKTKGKEQFFNRIWNYFDGFKILKLVHYLRDHYHGSIELEDAVTDLLGKMQKSKDNKDIEIVESLLNTYRLLEFKG